MGRHVSMFSVNIEKDQRKKSINDYGKQQHNFITTKKKKISSMLKELNEKN